ncbi:MAG: hypothetical protein ACHQF3_00485 [Alphaproteobacteria bacterium]
MLERRRVEERIRKKETEIQSLEAQIRDAKVYLQALQDVLKMMPREADDGMSDTALRPGSIVADAREAILRAGQPLHIIPLLEAMGKPLNRQNKTSVSSSIAAYVRRSEIFTRPAPNTFGLIELEHKVEPDAQSSPDVEPPSNFGEASPLEGPPSSKLDDEIPF